MAGQSSRRAALMGMGVVTVPPFLGNASGAPWQSWAMTRAQLVAFIGKHHLAVEASVAAGGTPQAAVVGIAVTEALELVFDTVDSSRKCANLRRDPRVALVIGWDEEQTVQLEGRADEPTGDELA